MTSNAGEEDPVVVVGLSFRFPQDAVTEEGFWDIICRRISTMTEAPEDRYNIDGHHVTGPARHGAVRKAIVTVNIIAAVMNSIFFKVAC